MPKHLVIKEVVREKRMHFYQVPRLGSYLAIKMEYDCSMYEEAYDAAVKDYIDVRNRRKEQEEEKKAVYEKTDEDRDDGTSNGEREGTREGTREGNRNG